MSLKLKTETAFAAIAAVSGTGSLNVYLSNNNQKVTQTLPALIFDAQVSDTQGPGRLQERRLVVVTVRSTANKDKDGDTPEVDHNDNVDVVATALKKSGAALRTDLNTYGGTGFYCLYANFLGSPEVEPEEGVFIESFAFDVVVMEQTVT